MIKNEEKNQTTLPSAQGDLPIGREKNGVLTAEWKNYKPYKK